MLKVETIPNDKIHKNAIELNYQTSYAQSNSFRNLYSFINLQIQPQSNILLSP